MCRTKALFINIKHAIRNYFEEIARSNMPIDYREKIRQKIFSWERTYSSTKLRQKALLLNMNFPGPYLVIYEDKNSINYEFSYSRFLASFIYHRKIAKHMKATRLFVELDIDIPKIEAIDDIYKIKNTSSRTYYE